MSDGAGFAGQVGLLAAGGLLTLGGSLVTTWLTDQRRFKREDAVRNEAAMREDQLREDERLHLRIVADRERHEQRAALERERRYEEEQQEVQRQLSLEAVSVVHLEAAYALVCQLIERTREKLLAGEDFTDDPLLQELYQEAGLVHDQETRERLEQLLQLIWGWDEVRELEGFDTDYREYPRIMAAARRMIAARLRGERSPMDAQVISDLHERYVSNS